MLTIPTIQLSENMELNKNEGGGTFTHSYAGSYDDLQEVIRADNDKKVASLIERHIIFFGTAFRPAKVEDVYSVREMILSLFDLRLLSQKDNVCPEDFLSLPIMVEEYDSFEELSTDEGYTESYHEFEALGKVADSKFMNLFSQRDTVYKATYRFKIKSDIYSDFLDEGTKKAGRNGYICDIKRVDEESMLEIRTPYIRQKRERFKDAVTYITDALFAIHLFDILTLTKGGFIFQSSQSLVSSLWYSAAESFRGGRTGRCEVCGKPFIAFNERGNKRLYCGQACNKKHQRLKRFKYLIDKGYEQEEASKLSKVRLKDGLEFVGNTNPTH